MPRSRANGPGARAVVWVQGCTLGCPGCFNPDTRSHAPRLLVNPVELAARIVRDGFQLEGVTISGGEPLQQAEPLLDFLREIRSGSSLSMLLFSGYTLEEIRAQALGPAVLVCTDVLVDGRYDRERHLGRGLRGSVNQRIHLLTDRYRLEEIEDTPSGEVIIAPDGVVTITGVDPRLSP